MAVPVKKIVFFCIIQIALVLLYIHKENSIIGRLYAVQNAQKELDRLTKKEHELHDKLQELQDYATLQEHAQQAGMKKARLSDIRRLP